MRYARLLGTSLLAVSLLLTSGCAAFVQYKAPVIPPKGMLFYSHKAPLTVDFQGNPTDPGLVKVSRTNTQYLHDILLTGLNFAWDEAAIAQLAREEGIQNVSYADYEILNILGAYARFTVNVYGTR